MKAAPFAERVVPIVVPSVSFDEPTRICKTYPYLEMVKRSRRIRQRCLRHRSHRGRACAIIPDPTPVVALEKDNLNVSKQQPFYVVVRQSRAFPIPPGLAFVIAPEEDELTSQKPQPFYMVNLRTDQIGGHFEEYASERRLRGYKDQLL